MRGDDGRAEREALRIGPPDSLPPWSRRGDRGGGRLVSSFGEEVASVVGRDGVEPSMGGDDGRVAGATNVSPWARRPSCDASTVLRASCMDTADVPERN